MSLKTVEQKKFSLKSPMIALTRSAFYGSFLLFCALPLLSFYFCREYFLWVSGASFMGSLLVFYCFEKQMQHAVFRLVKAKVHKLGSFQGKGEKEREEISKYIAEVKRNCDLEIAKKVEEVKEAFLEFEATKKENVKLATECAHLKEEAQKAMEKKQALLSEYHQTVAEQRTIIEKNKRYIGQLESKVTDLMREMRALLHLETPSKASLPIPEVEENLEYRSTNPKQASSYDFSILLKKYIDRAENFSGVSALGRNLGSKNTASRFLAASSSHFTIDHRPFFDAFREERGSIVFIYSLFEMKMLFANNVVKTALGYSPDRFIKEFPHFIVDGYSDWKRAIEAMLEEREKSLNLLMKTKTGEEIPFQCLLGTIQEGPFANHIIGLLF